MWTHAALFSTTLNSLRSVLLVCERFRLFTVAVLFLFFKHSIFSFCNQYNLLTYYIFVVLFFADNFMFSFNLNIHMQIYFVLKCSSSNVYF